MSKKEKLCPRCLRDKVPLDALSRRDNKTYICSRCGEEEGLIDADLIDDPFMLGVDKIFVKALKEKSL